MIILQNIQKILSNKIEILHNLFVDTHPAQNINKRRKDIEVVS